MIPISSNKRSGQDREFPSTQAALKRMAPAPTTAAVESNARKTGGNDGTKYPDTATVNGPVDPPSSRYRTYQQRGLLSVSIPENWQQFDDDSSVTFAPNGAFGNMQGQSVFTHGAIVGAADTRTTDLTVVSDQYVAGILKGNAYLQAQGSSQRTQLGGRTALLRRLTGKSPVTNQKEVVDVYTAFSNRNQFVYMVHVAPGNALAQYRNAFNQMARSFTFLD